MTTPEQRFGQTFDLDKTLDAIEYLGGVTAAEMVADLTADDAEVVRRSVTVAARSSAPGFAKYGTGVLAALDGTDFPVADILDAIGEDDLLMVAEFAHACALVESAGLANFGAALLNSVRAENARRDLEIARKLAYLAALDAELHVVPDDPVGDISGLPSWSEVSRRADED